MLILTVFPFSTKVTLLMCYCDNLCNHSQIINRFKKRIKIHKRNTQKYIHALLILYTYNVCVFIDILLPLFHLNDAKKKKKKQKQP